MRRVTARLVMGAVGLAVVLASLGAAWLGVLAVGALWRARPAPLTSLAWFLLVAVAVGYLSHRVGTEQLLGSLEAAELSRAHAPEVYRRLDRLVTTMDVPRVHLLVARLSEPNALALQRGREGVVVVDVDLFRILDADEFEALLAHELAHLEAHDTLVRTLGFGVGQTFVGLLSLVVLPLAWLLGGLAHGSAWLAGRPDAWPLTPAGRVRRLLDHLLLAAFVGVTLLAFAHSRRREYAADDRAAEVADGFALARALARIDRTVRSGLAGPSPLSVHGDDDGLRALLSTHPPVGDRIERLERRAGRRARD